VLGDFVEYVNGFPRRIAAPPDAGWTLDEVFVDLLGPLGIPVLSGLPVGHGVRNFALPFGTRARFEGATLVVDPTTSPSRSRIA
jgi:muramoyltetrapeptide carboxypeptidase LdcA involved in peptidoglycan recycling